MVDIYDYDIRLIEDEILMKCNDSRYDYTKFGCLLEMRKRMINKRTLAHQEKILHDIIAFNDALTAALREMYDMAHRVWDNIKNYDTFGDDVELAAKCFIGRNYPALHPIQGKDRQELWDAICDSGWNPMYEDGVPLPTYTLPSDIDKSFDSLIGMDCPPPNWNEGLEQELTEDLHLTSAFHHIFDHMNFAITDFIYAREFELEINIKSTNKL